MTFAAETFPHIITNLSQDCELRLSRRGKPAWVEEVIAYMIENYAEDLTLEDLANAVSVSKFNFCRQFHRYQGMPPLRWLWRFRASLAGELLRLPHEQDIKDVAYTCGFSSGAHFSRIFREVFGTTPTRYRTQMLALHGIGADVSQNLRPIA